MADEHWFPIDMLSTRFSDQFYSIWILECVFDANSQHFVPLNRYKGYETAC